MIIKTVKFFCTKGYNWNKNRVEYNPALIYII